jgi:hypothetical protein
MLWLRRAELNVILTRRLQSVPGCADCTVRVGPSVPVDDFEKSNWSEFVVTAAPGSLEEWKVRAVAGGVVSEAREVYNVVDDLSHPSPFK